MTDTAAAGRLIQGAIQNYKDRYGQEPDRGAIAPGRVNLIGDHTDYTGGWSLPFAIDAYTVILAAPGQQTRWQVASATMETASEIRLDDTPIAPSPDWSAYLRGVLEGYRQRGIVANGLDVFCQTSLPMGSGLSSSAALEVATALLIEIGHPAPLPALERITLCRDAEHLYAGVPCGFLDQFSVSMAQPGHLMALDNRTLSAEQVPFDAGRAQLYLINSGVTHTHSNSGYAERRAQCEAAESKLGRSLRECVIADVEAQTDLSPEEHHRARHVVTENARVGDAIEALRARDFAALGQAMQQSHQSMTEDFDGSTPEIDFLVDLLNKNDAVLGARMTGGGFGGSVIMLAAREMDSASLANLLAPYNQKFSQIATPMPVGPVRGARALSELRNE